MPPSRAPHNFQRLADELIANLRPLGTHDRATAEKRYLKSDLDHLGVSVPLVRQAARSLAKVHGLRDRTDIVALARTLWASPLYESRLAAVLLLQAHAARLTPEDLPLLESLLRQSRTWALVDTLAVYVLGSIADRFPLEAGKDLDAFAVDDDFWIRRSALLALLLPLRRGAGDFDRFSRYADPMLGEKEFFIRKAIGWVLRETAKKSPDRVRAWIAPRKTRMAGLTLREAQKGLPDTGT